MGRRDLRRLIWGCTICLHVCPTKRTSDLKVLSKLNIHKSNICDGLTSTMQCFMQGLMTTITFQNEISYCNQFDLDDACKTIRMGSSELFSKCTTYLQCIKTLNP